MPSTSNLIENDAHLYGAVTSKPTTSNMIESNVLYSMVQSSIDSLSYAIIESSSYEYTVLQAVLSNFHYKGKLMNLTAQEIALMIEIECLFKQDTYSSFFNDHCNLYIERLLRFTRSKIFHPSMYNVIYHALSFIFDIIIVVYDIQSKLPVIISHHNSELINPENCVYLLKNYHIFDCMILELNSSSGIDGQVNSNESQCHQSTDEYGSSAENYDTVKDATIFPTIADFRQKHLSNFIFLHNNLNSYRNKHIYASDILSNNLVDLMIYSESKLDQNFFDNEFMLDGYELYRQDNTGDSGGILCHLRSDIPHCRLKDAEIIMHGFESLILKVVIGDSETVFVMFYKHPYLSDSDFKTQFCKIADRLLSSHSDIVFIGDANCCPRRCSVISDLCDLYGLKNIVKGPTCFKNRTNPTSIDVILVTNPARYTGTLNAEFPLSDFHNVIGAATRRHAPSLKPYSIKYRSYKKFDERDFLNDLQCAPFHVAEIFDEVDDMAWFTSNLISYTLDGHAPPKTRWLKKKSAPFMNSELRKAVFSRNMARTNFHLYGRSCWEAFRQKRNLLTSCKKKSIKNYFLKNGDPSEKRFWPTVSPFLSEKRKKGNETISLIENGKIVNTPSEVAEIFNNHYSSIASSIGFDDKIDSVEDSIEKHKNHPSIAKIREKHPDLCDNFTFRSVSEDTVCGYLKRFDSKKATGYDNIPGRIIKLACNEIAPPLTKIINTSIEHNSFPDTLKKAEIGPVYKKDDRLVKNNYRPVSVLTGISKVFEYLMNDQLLEHFVNIFNALLSAYRKGYSCQSVLLKLIEDAKSKIDLGMLVGLLLQDLSKAFDCLPHGLLIAKLHAYGLSISACKLIASYLCDRKQRVKISSYKSEWEDLLKGVPQGSVLGPLLFNIFINDLFFFMERCNLNNFADDNSLSSWSYSLNEVICNLEHDSNICIEWYKSNGMEAEPSKFQFIVLSPIPLSTIKINVYRNIVVESKSVVKALGVNIDCQLNFEFHTQKLCSSASRQLNAFARLAKHLNLEAKRLLFLCFLMSNFEYCPIVWHFCGKGNNDKMENIQKRALKIVFSDFDAEYEDLLQKFGTTTVFQRRINRIVTEVYKIINNISPSYLNSLFEIKKTPYGLKDPLRIEQPRKKKTTFGLRSINYVGSKLWNELPLHIKKSSDVVEFKRALKDWSGVNLNTCESFFI